MIIDSGSRDGPLGPVLSSTFAIQPCAHRGQNLGHIPYQVIVNLGRVHHDQIAWLATTLNTMLTRLQRALAHEQQFVADASHELRTPLALLTTELELRCAGPDPPTS